MAVGRTCLLYPRLRPLLISIAIAVFCSHDRRAGAFNSGGVSCTLRDGGIGVCTVISQCPSAIEIIKHEKPVHCGFYGNLPIICCGNEKNKTDNWTMSKRIAEAKCRQYTRIVTTVSGVLPLLPNVEPSTVETPKCDLPELPLIVGGSETELGEFPHMAALGYQEGDRLSWYCGGTLISEHYVMTAAHCIVTRIGPPVVVRLGDYNLAREDDGAFPVDYAVESVRRHPQYKPPSKYHDVALVRLKDTVRLSTSIRPACLHTEPAVTFRRAVATGWGQLGYVEPQSDVLLKVGLDVVDNNLCNRLYQTISGLRNGISEGMLCAGDLAGGHDTCQGDSGGPLQVTDRKNRCVYHVVGVTSFGKICATKNAPGVYSRVSHYLPWIVGVVWA